MEKQTSKRFSVVIPTYNRKDLLKQALGSVLSQDYPKDGFEIVIVNDGSTDGTKKFLKTFVDEHKDFRIIVVNSDRNYGIAHTRNLTIDNSSGEIIAYLDDDCVADSTWLRSLDYIYSSKPELVSVGVKLVNAYPENILARFFYNTHIYSMNTLHIPRDNTISGMMKRFKSPENDCYADLGGTGHISLKRSVWEEIGPYDERITYAEDIEFNIRLRQKYLPKQIYYTNSTYVKHFYKTTLRGVLKQFFNYGQGGYHFRDMRSRISGKKSFWHSRIYTIKYIIALSRYTQGNNLDFIPLLIIAILSNISLLVGEAYKTAKEEVLQK